MPGQSYAVPIGGNIWTELRKEMGGFGFVPLELQPGQYFKRMARPTSIHFHESPGSNPENSKLSEIIENYATQLLALKENLERIFRVVHPAQSNLDVYGHEIRNILILSATEVEAQWKQILKANSVEGQSTADYIKLLDPMRLAEYEVALPYYPWIAPAKPFVSWHKSAPTKTLPWYNAYNSVKHNREDEFQSATLNFAIQSCCACAVMLFAQFGVTASHARHEINTFFKLRRAPTWHPAEVYAPAGKTGLAEVAVPFPF